MSNASFELIPIGRVEGARANVEDDFWGGAESRIVLNESVEESALAGIETFSHAEILFVFDRVEPAKIIRVTIRPGRSPASSRSARRIGRTASAARSVASCAARAARCS